MLPMTPENVKNYQICVKTVMDTSDPSISFDSQGISNHFHNYHKNVKPNWHLGPQGKEALEDIVKTIKSSSSSHEYNCILGLSGGLDSSYMLHKMVTEYNLKPLVFHVDAGWNTDTAVHNINQLVDGLNLDLFTEVINWDEVRRFQLAMFRSGLPHLDLPQDIAFISTLYSYCDKYNIKYILNGGNISTESVLMPLEILYWGTDMRHVRDILSKHLDGELPTFPFTNILYHKIYLRYLRNVKVVKPLNYMPFNKSSATAELVKEYGWRPYPQKHFESRFTRFFEGFWLLNRFNYDMRRNQLSSLILSDQISRDSALDILTKPPLTSEESAKDFDYVSSKLQITVDELTSYLHSPLKYYWDYKNSKSLFDFGSKILNKLSPTQRGGAF